MLSKVRVVEANMPVACLRDSKRRTESEMRESAALQRTEWDERPSPSSPASNQKQRII